MTLESSPTPPAWERESPHFPFPLEEYDARLARVRSEMARRAVDVLLVTEPENMYYLAGYVTPAYWAPQMLVVPLDGAPGLVIPSAEEPTLRETSRLTTFAVYQDAEQPHECMGAALKRWGLARGRVGVEANSWFLTVAGYERLRGQLPEAAWVDCSNLVSWQRIVKSPREIEYLRRASRAAEAGVRAGLDAAEAGRTEADLAEAIFAAMVRHGSDRVELGVIASGERILLTHGRFTHRRLELGDAIRFELTGRCMQYDGRFMRSVILGQPPATMARDADAAAQALGHAISQMRPGAVAGEIARIAVEGLREVTGFQWPTKIGYPMGIMFVPNPGEHNLRTLMPGDTWVLESGMVFHMLLCGPGMVGHSEMVVVTDQGHEVLTTLERRLFVKA